MKRIELREIIKEEIRRLNEGANEETTGNVINQLGNLLDDFIAGVRGQNGSGDPKHPNAVAMTKEIMKMKKILPLVKKAAGKDKNFKLWFRNF